MKFTVEVEIDAAEKDGRNVTAAMVRTTLREFMLFSECTRCYGDGRCVVYTARVGKVVVSNAP